MREFRCYYEVEHGQCDEGCKEYYKDQSCVRRIEVYQRDKRVAEDRSLFEKRGIVVEDCQQGLCVEGKYIYSPKSRKWRKIGKGKWYYSKGVEHFLGVTQM